MFDFEMDNKPKHEYGAPMYEKPTVFEPRKRNPYINFLKWFAVGCLIALTIEMTVGF